MRMWSSFKSKVRPGLSLVAFRLEVFCVSNASERSSIFQSSLSRASGLFFYPAPVLQNPFFLASFPSTGCFFSRFRCRCLSERTPDLLISLPIRQICQDALHSCLMLSYGFCHTKVYYWLWIRSCPSRTGPAADLLPRKAQASQASEQVFAGFLRNWVRNLAM